MYVSREIKKYKSTQLIKQCIMMKFPLKNEKNSTPQKISEMRQKHGAKLDQLFKKCYF